ncbi:hypothetical protein I7I50_00062 [Histoplasma capsulatum G186AR]|uniref:Uncharacterized protein n=1 Tax=Ajellomyces capsulatus TaxID=5037 RepID=A0A8H7YIG8_AJECA|nr:hypothetical protein I7I52_07331 [Histoplasma capsulatum]QSS72264.1 hypothetical protein I7I50_00062 [Histoplasma capsulatum G186AR]
MWRMYSSTALLKLSSATGSAWVKPQSRRRMPMDSLSKVSTVLGSVKAESGRRSGLMRVWSRWWWRYPRRCRFVARWSVDSASKGEEGRFVGEEAEAVGGGGILILEGAVGDKMRSGAFEAGRCGAERASEERSNQIFLDIRGAVPSRGSTLHDGLALFLIAAGRILWNNKL